MHSNRPNGFSLIEIVIVMFFFSTLSGLVTVNLIRTKHQASLTASINTLLTDIKLQQTKAMTGDTQGEIVSEDYGIYFENDRYILFRGDSYNPAAADNFPVNLETTLEIINISFPLASIVLSSRSGEVAGFIEGANTVTIKNTGTNEQKTITINRYGVVTNIN